MRKNRYFSLFAGILLVFTSTGGLNASQPKELVPSRILDRPVSQGMVKDLLYFEGKHSLSVGDKGEDRYDVSTQPPVCDKEALVFDSARIVYRRQRFGEAKILSSPKPGCIRCSPLVVRWYHEPTGKLDYQVHVYRRRIQGSCS